MSPRHIVLVGAPGAGKSTIGALLAQRLDRLFVDTDVVVERLSGQDLPELFITEGEPGVRRFERQALADGLGGAPAVVALGSGAVLDDDIRTAVGGSPTVWLRVTAPNAISRLGLNAPRPVALGNIRAQFAAMMAQREPRYAELATCTVDTDHRPAEDVLTGVVSALTQAGAI